jgi:hypothetical protein
MSVCVLNICVDVSDTAHYTLEHTLFETIGKD